MAANLNGDTKNLAAALLAFHREKVNLPKDKTNPRFESKYTSLDKMVEVVTPLLAKPGSCGSRSPNGIAAEPDARVQADPRRDRRVARGHDPAACSKASRPARRWAPRSRTSATVRALHAVLNLSADEDDDGNTAESSAGAVEVRSAVRADARDRRGGDGPAEEEDPRRPLTRRRERLGHPARHLPRAVREGFAAGEGHCGCGDEGSGGPGD